MFFDGHEARRSATTTGMTFMTVISIIVTCDVRRMHQLAVGMNVALIEASQEPFVQGSAQFHDTEAQAFSEFGLVWKLIY